MTGACYSVVAPDKRDGNFLKAVRKDFDIAEEMYQAALQLDPAHIAALSNYGHFLHTITKDYDSAEEKYKAALSADS